VNIKSRVDNLNQGFGALHFASEMSSLEIISVLVSAEGINVNQTEMLGRTPVHWAAIKGSTEALLALLKAGAAPDLCDSDNRTPLALAAQVGRADVVSFLLQNAKVRVNFQDSTGNTILHHAAEIHMQKYLFNYNWQMKSQHRAVFFKLITQSDADPTIPNNEGDSPLDVLIEPLAAIFEIVHKNKELLHIVPSFAAFMEMRPEQLSGLGMSNEDVVKVQDAMVQYKSQVPRNTSGCNYIPKSNVPNKRKFKNRGITSSPIEENATPLRCPLGFTGPKNPHLDNTLQKDTLDSQKPLHKNTPTISPTRPVSTLVPTPQKATPHIERKTEKYQFLDFQILMILGHPLFWLYTVLLIGITWKISRIYSCE